MNKTTTKSLFSYYNENKVPHETLYATKAATPAQTEQ